MNQIKKTLYELIGRDDFKIHLRNAGVFRFPVGYRFEDHIQAEVEIFCVKSGNCVAVVEGKLIPMKEGHRLVVQPFVKHGMTVEAQVSYSLAQVEYCVNYPKELAQGISFLNNEERYFKIENCQNICNIITNISRYYRQSPITDLIYTQIELGFAQLFLELSYHLDIKKNNFGKGGAEEDRMQRILSYLNEHFEENLRIEEIAERFGISSRYIRKYFAKEMGINCNNYVTVLRIEKAKELLWNTTRSITDIAMLTGFNSSQYFSRVFQKITGIRPNEYRNMWRGKIADVNYQINREENV